MHFTQSQVSKLIEEVVSKEDGLNTILKMSLDALMKSERTQHNQQYRDLSNGFRTRRAFGDKQMIELQVPRTRSGNYYSVVLALLKHQVKHVTLLFTCINRD